MKQTDIIGDLEKPLKFPKSPKKDFENFPENKGYSKSPIDKLSVKALRQHPKPCIN